MKLNQLTISQIKDSLYSTQAEYSLFGGRPNWQWRVQTWLKDWNRNRYIQSIGFTGLACIYKFNPDLYIQGEEGE